MTARVLVCDDEAGVRFALTELLEARGFEAVGVPDAASALVRLAEADVLLTDLAMPGMDGLALLRRVRELRPELPVLLLTARGSERVAVEAMKAGAFDYLPKPFDVDEVALSVGRAAEAVRLRGLARRARAESRSGRPLLGESPRMRALVQTIERVAPRDVTVLVRGETGTGKELVAQLLHDLSPRASAPFVRFNAAALPVDLSESELFGHRRGAFTGAVQDRIGLFERAHRGTLLVDEVGELDLAVQAKLLRAVQEGEVLPLGAREPRTVDVRIVACTHRDLRAEVDAGRFREDLYYRLAVVELEVPPLRARPEDVDELALHFAARAARRFGIEAVELAPELVRRLGAMPWRGNVRELENLVTRLVAFSDGGRIDASALDVTTAGPSVLPTSEATYRAKVDAFERSLLREALAASQGNQAEAARRLGMSRVTMLDRLKRLGER